MWRSCLQHLETAVASTSSRRLSTIDLTGVRAKGRLGIDGPSRDKLLLIVTMRSICWESLRTQAPFPLLWRYYRMNR